MPPTVDGYRFTEKQFTTLLLQKFFPERTDYESAVLRDYLLAHIDDFDTLDFAVRVGQGQTPDPAHLPAVQANSVRSSQKKIDLLAWTGSQPVIVEVKFRVQPSALGQVWTYSHLFVEEHPDVPEPKLVVVGRYADNDTIRAIQAGGVDVHIFPAAEDSGLAGVGRLRSPRGETA